MTSDDVCGGPIRRMIDNQRINDSSKLKTQKAVKRKRMTLHQREMVSRLRAISERAVLEVRLGLNHTGCSVINCREEPQLKQSGTAKAQPFVCTGKGLFVLEINRLINTDEGG